MAYCVMRNPRRDPVTKKCNELFSNALHQENYEQAAQIVLFNVFSVYGAKGIMNALDDANLFIERRKMRRGL